MRDLDGTCARCDVPVKWHEGALYHDPPGFHDHIATRRMNGKDYIVVEAALKKAAIAYSNGRLSREKLGLAADAYAACCSEEVARGP